MNITNFIIISAISLIVYFVLLFKNQEYYAYAVKILLLGFLFLAEILDATGILSMTNPNEEFMVLSVMITAFFVLEIIDTFFDMVSLQKKKNSNKKE